MFKKNNEMEEQVNSMTNEIRGYLQKIDKFEAENLKRTFEQAGYKVPGHFSRTDCSAEKQVYTRHLFVGGDANVQRAV